MHERCRAGGAVHIVNAHTHHQKLYINKEFRFDFTAYFRTTVAFVF